VTTNDTTWDGCQLAAPHADYWHAAHDFASSTLCGIALAGSGLSERYDGKRAMCPACQRALAPGEAHVAIITQAGTTGYLLASPPDGYLVTCPHGCNLGTAARQPTREGAERRVRLHKIATTPLTRER